MTTGCLLLATTPHMSRELSRQFQQGLIEKTYLAVVHGVPNQSGTIRKALMLRNGRVSVTDKGKESITSWELLGYVCNSYSNIFRLLTFYSRVDELCFALN